MIDLPHNFDDVKGFLSKDEGEILFQTAQVASCLGPLLEIGSYCGKSTICLASACVKNAGTVYTLDHHLGSEEHQIGEAFHDPELANKKTGMHDSFAEFRKNIFDAKVEDYVVPIVAESSVVARAWRTPLAMVFIDGGHSLRAALSDYRNWTQFLLKGGFLAIHDVFDDPEEGGQAPRAIHDLAIASGLFSPYTKKNSLRILERV